MAKWQLTCSCGDTFEAEGNTKEEAVDNFMSTMTPEDMQKHMMEKHAGEPMMTPEQAREGFIASAQMVG